MQAALRAGFGMDDPIWARYLHWLVAMLHGDWGFSFVSRVDVDTLILQRLPTTLGVIGASQVLALLISAAARGIGGDAAVFVLRPVRQHAGADRVLRLAFFTGLVFILVFSIQLDWLPSSSVPTGRTGLPGGGREFKQSIMPTS